MNLVSYIYTFNKEFDFDKHYQMKVYAIKKDNILKYDLHVIAIFCIKLSNQKKEILDNKIT